MTQLLQLSPARLKPYRDFFGTKNDEELLGVYLWAQALATSLNPFVTLVEVSLRNAIHTSLSQRVSQGQSASFAWYDRSTNNEIVLYGRSFTNVEELLCEGIPPIRRVPQPTPDAVVATLSLGFWPNVMETLNNRVAPKTFLEVFPHHPHSTMKHWGHRANRDAVVSLMKTLQKLRNRVCHSEPVWKLHTLDVTGKRWWHAVQGLRDRHEELLQLLEWRGGTVCVQAYRTTFAWNWFNVLCTTGAVNDFMTNQGRGLRLKPITSPLVIITEYEP